MCTKHHDVLYYHYPFINDQKQQQLLPHNYWMRGIVTTSRCRVMEAEGLVDIDASVSIVSSAVGAGDGWCGAYGCMDKVWMG